MRPGTEEQFCCGGCETAHRILSGAGLGEYYAFRQRLGEAGRPIGDALPDVLEFDSPAYRRLYCEEGTDGRLRTEFALEGMHCAEYATDALVDSHLIKVKNAPRVSPASLREALLRTELYKSTRFVQLVAEEAPIEKGDTWCSQLWIDTKVCTSTCCTKLRRWFLCR